MPGELSSPPPAGSDPRAAVSAGDNSPVLLLELSRVFTTRKWVFLTVAGLVVLAAIVQTVRATPVFRATSQVLVERQYQQLREFNDPVAVDTLEVDYYNTQLKILQGPGLAERVARVMDLSERPECRGRDPADLVLAGLQVELPKNNRVFEVSYEHPDPEFAANLVNTLVREYERDTVERRLKSIDDLSAQMSRKLGDVRLAMDRSDRQLMEFYQRHELLLAEEREGGYQKLLNDTALSQARQEDELKRLEAVTEQIEAARSDIQKLRSLESVVLDSQAIRDMRREEAMLHAEAAAAREKYKEKHPLRVDAEVRAAEMTRKIDEEIRANARSYVMRRDATRRSVDELRAKFEEIRKRQMERDALVVQADQLRRERDANRTLFETLTLRIKESEISSKIEATNVHVLDAAKTPPSPVRPDPIRNLMMGSVLAVFAGIAVTLLLERLDNRVRTPEDVEIPYGLPVLAVIPERRVDESTGPPALACWQEERSQVAEGFRQLRAAILLSLREENEGGAIRTVLVGSAGPGDGKTITAVNLAISLAQTGARTLLLDTDFHRSEAHKLFGIDRDKGLSTLLTSDIPFAQAVQTTPVPYLDFMATGMIPPQPASVLGSARMRWVLEEASRGYQKVVIDTAPLAAVTDAAMLAPFADALVLVARQGKTTKSAFRRSIQLLSRIGVRPLGIVFNGLNVGLGDFYFKYHHPVYDIDREAAPSRESDRTL